MSHQDSRIKYLAEWHQLYDEVVFELSYIGRMVRRNKLSRVFDLCINKIKLNYSSIILSQPSGFTEHKDVSSNTTCYLGGHMTLQEVYKPYCLLLFREVEIHAISECHYIKAV